MRNGVGHHTGLKLLFADLLPGAVYARAVSAVALDNMARLISLTGSAQEARLIDRRLRQRRQLDNRNRKALREEFLTLATDKNTDESYY
ncbi:hypothetical protein D3C84_994410 [compost metagenome]